MYALCLNVKPMCTVLISARLSIVNKLHRVHKRFINDIVITQVGSDIFHLLVYLTVERVSRDRYT